MTELTLLSGYRGQLAGRGHEICLSQAIPSVCPERAGVFPPIPWPVAAPPLPLGGQAPPHVPGWDKETLRGPVTVAPQGLVCALVAFF